LRLTQRQNVVLTGIEEEDLEEFKDEPLLDDIPVDPSPFRRGAISCTGTEFCNLALIETKNRMVDWVKRLEESVEIDSPLRVHLSGCNASCAQPQIADIGFQGSKTRKDGEVVEAVNVGIGGGLGPNPEFIDWVIKGVACEDAVDLVSDIIEEYKEDSKEDETFRDYVRRVGTEEVAERAQNGSEEAA
jgi:ferredoxin-nitrite reductase